MKEKEADFIYFVSAKKSVEVDLCSQAFALLGLSQPNDNKFFEFRSKRNDSDVLLFERRQVKQADMPSKCIIKLDDGQGKLGRWKI